MLSSGSKALAVVLVARVLSADDFGRFALAYAMLTMSLAFSRSWFGTRVSLDKDRAKALAGDVVAALLLLALVVVVLVLGLSVLSAGTSSLGILLLVACATPLVLVHDIVRFGAAAAGQPFTALVSDAVWLAVMATPFVLGWSLSPAGALGLWMGGAVAAAITALVMFGQRPRWRTGLAELRRRHRVGESVTLGSVIMLVSSLVLLLVVSRVLGPAAAGALRAAATTMGPVNVLLAFTGLGLVPVLVRKCRDSDVRFCLSTSGVLLLLTAGWGVLLLLLPDAAGRAAFGDSWTGLRKVLPWTLVEYCSAVVASGAVLGLKVRHLARALVRQRLVSGVVTLGGGLLVLALGGGTQAVAGALAAAALLAAVAAWVQLLRSRPTVDEGRRPAVDPPSVETAAGGAR